MVDLWRAVAPCVSLSSTELKSTVDVQQTAAGTRVVRAYRMWHFEGTQRSVSAAFLPMVIGRINSQDANKASLFALPAKSTQLLPDTITTGSGRGPSEVAVLRRYIRSPDEFLNSETEHIDHWEFDVPMAEVWNAGYRDANIQPIVIRPGQGVHIRQDDTASTTTEADYEIEFTVSST